MEGTEVGKRLERPTVKFGDIVLLRDGRMRRFLGPCVSVYHDDAVAWEAIKPRRCSSGWAQPPRLVDREHPDGSISYSQAMESAGWDRLIAGGCVLSDDEVKWLGFVVVSDEGV